MKSEWKVTMQYIDGERLYAVYRIINTGQPDHSGNREYATGYMEDKAQAEFIAESLNVEESEADKERLSE